MTSYCYVIGAGASCEFGLPSGAELKKKIQSVCDIRFGRGPRQLEAGDPEFVSTLQRIVTEEGRRSGINDFLEAAWEIRNNMDLAPSIDNFLEARRDERDVVFLGKLAISKAIADAERSSKLFEKQIDSHFGFNFARLGNPWLLSFFQLAAERNTFEKFKEKLNDIVFISFNYDRCIAQFLYYSVKSYFHLDPQSAAEFVASVKIIYPYGSLGELKFDAGEGSTFGLDGTGSRLRESADKIRTFTEYFDNSNLLEEVRSHVASCDILAFLGFGYHEQNMQLLFDGRKIEASRIIGTAKAASSSDVEEIQSIIASGRNRPQIKSRIFLEDLYCSDLISSYRRVLAK